MIMTITWTKGFQHMVRVKRVTIRGSDVEYMRADSTLPELLNTEWCYSVDFAPEVPA